MMFLVAKIFSVFIIIFLLILKFGSKPYPKHFEEKENQELLRKIKEYETNQD